MKLSNVPRALTIAGSDSGGGAGIQADLKVFALLGVHGMSAVTAITAQNTLGVAGIWSLPPEAVEAQIDCVTRDIGVDAVKTGMLATAEIVRSVAGKIREHDLKNFVLDPVMVAKGGHRLLTEDAEAALIDSLLPLALVVTPNIPEAEVLTGLKIHGIADMIEAARVIKRMGAGAVVIKGGHMEADEALDVYYDGEEHLYLRKPWFQTTSNHGTGCTFSAAITAGLASGMDLFGAVNRAKEFVSAALEGAVKIGSGHGPTNAWAGLARVGPVRYPLTNDGTGRWL